MATISAREAAARLGVSYSTAVRWAQKGKIDGEKVLRPGYMAPKFQISEASVAALEPKEPTLSGRSCQLNPEILPAFDAPPLPNVAPEAPGVVFLRLVVRALPSSFRRALKTLLDEVQ